jgi:hypothetical protein
MLIHNHLNITGPMRDIDEIAMAFMREEPFAKLYPLPPLERQTQYAIEEQRTKAWGTPHDAFRPSIIDVFDHSLAVEFWTTDREPEPFIRFIARLYPQLAGVNQFMSDGRSLARSGTMRIQSGKVFTRSYTQPRKEYA